jgi:hypothetical protein
VLWREGGDTIYAVPQRSKSLVYAIPKSSVIGRAPIHGLDIAPIEPYLAALDGPSLPVPEVTWHSRHSATIRAELRPDQVISVQVNYHPGWSATVNGASPRIHPDGAGLMIIEPDCTGTCEIGLRYGPSLEMYLALAGSVLLMGGVVAYHVTSGRFPRL